MLTLAPVNRAYQRRSRRSNERFSPAISEINRTVTCAFCVGDSQCSEGNRPGPSQLRTGQILSFSRFRNHFGSSASCPRAPGCRAKWHPARSPKARVGLTDITRFVRMANPVVSSLRPQVDLVVANGFARNHRPRLSNCHFVHGAGMNSPFHISRLHRGPYGWYQWLFTRMNAAWEKKTYAAAKHIVAVSSKVRDELVQIGVPAKKIQTVVNGVDLDEFFPGYQRRDELGLPANVPSALFVGDIRTPAQEPGHRVVRDREITSGALGRGGRFEE